MITPSSRFLGETIVKHIPVGSKILEIGAGTGPITQSIVGKGFKNDDLTICERDSDFCELLRNRFPDYPVICQDALQTHTFLDEHSVDVVVSGLPLRNFSSQFKQDYISSLKRVLKPNGIILHYTYGVTSPLPLLKGELCDYTIANLPPAFVWKYSLK